MEYTQATITLDADNQDNRDIITAMLGNEGYESFTENENSIDAYIPSSKFTKETIDKILHILPFNAQYTYVAIPEQNWNEVWEKNYFKPLLVANKCLIRAPFHTDYPKAQYEIIIEPKMAFGTGNHETTSLMIEYVLETTLDGKKILDMGCGTGILAILASMTGAQNITAIDFDKWAYENTIENSQINKCNNIEVKHGDAKSIGKNTYDVIFANIQKNVLLTDILTYARAMNTKALLFVSGFYKPDLPDIKTKAQSVGLNYVSHKIKNNWIAAAFTKPI